MECKPKKPRAVVWSEKESMDLIDMVSEEEENLLETMTEVLRTKQRRGRRARCGRPSPID
jgi:hypothetical protein